MRALAASALALPHTSPLEAPFALAAPLPSGGEGSGFLEAFLGTMRRSGHPQTQAGDPAARVVLNPVDAAGAKGFHRATPGQFVVSILRGSEGDTDRLGYAYPFLIRTLANLCLLVTPQQTGGVTVHAITLERGVYAVGAGLQGGDLAAAVYQRIKPLALSHLMIGNQFTHDLPPAMWGGTTETRALAHAGAWLAKQHLLVAPFPLDELLSKADLRHVQLLFGLGGLSYGNLSTRHAVSSFWMSSSGVDKRSLQVVGQDFALVTGLDVERGALTVSVPETVQRPRHVSVDAIEHYMIYRDHPGVGAVIHLHAWMEGAPVTTVNYPCGTFELAAEVSGLLRRAADPTRAVIGLKNHGITVTGRSMDDILARVTGRLLPQAPPLD